MVFKNYQIITNQSLLLHCSGTMMKKVGEDYVREKHESEVDASIKNVDYSHTFYQIDKGNMTEAKYVIA